MLETGRYATIKEIAKAEKINLSYVSRVPRLTLLAPAAVETILDGRPHAATHWPRPWLPFPLVWAEQGWQAAAGGANGVKGAPYTPDISRRLVTALRSIKAILAETEPLLAVPARPIDLSLSCRALRRPDRQERGATLLVDIAAPA